MTLNQRTEQETKTSGRTRIFLWVCTIGLVVLALGTIFWKRRFHDYTPAAAVLDLRAAYEARHAPVPMKRFLELRYGDQEDPANRTAAVIDFFNVGHIDGLSLMVGKHPGQRTREGISNVAKTLHDYRQNMTPEDKKILADHFNSAEGREQLRTATGSFQSKNPQFRALVAPVIQELMTTLATVQTH